MLGDTLCPPLIANRAGRADSALTWLLFWLMCAGFVRAVEFMPRSRGWRWVFSGWARTVTFVLASLMTLE